jgi:hypothetical protein
MVLELRGTPIIPRWLNSPCNIETNSGGGVFQVFWNQLISNRTIPLSGTHTSYLAINRALLLVKL